MENCGILAVIGPEYAMDYVVENLNELQHRGQESAGAATSHNKNIVVIKGVGLVEDVFSNYKKRMHVGKCAIGGTRYSTIGHDLERDAKPIVRYLKISEANIKDAYRTEKPIHLEDVLQIAADHNGNDPYFFKIKNEAEKKGVEFGSNNDLEGFLFKQMEFFFEKGNVNDEIIFNSIKYAANTWNGSISLVELVNDCVFAFREKFGIKPLVWGYVEMSWGKLYGVSSEGIALIEIGIPKENIKEFPPGYAAKFKPGEKPFFKKLFSVEKKAYCLFEYPYFARVDSWINGISIAEFRYRIGSILGEEFKKRKIKLNAVCPVPETARTAAIAFAEKLNAPYREDIILRNRFFGRRAFMLPDSYRKKAIGKKYHFNCWIPSLEKIAIVDDSIVRGETLKRIIEKIKERIDVKEIYAVITFPKICSPCPYGIDMQRRKKLIGSDKSVEEIAREIGVTEVIYPELWMYEKALGIKKENFCIGCTYGKYPTKIDSSILEEIENERVEAHKIIS